MEFPPFKLWTRVRAIQGHSTTAAPNKYGYRLVGVAVGSTGTLGYYSNDGWKFHVMWDDETDLTAEYRFSDWGKLVEALEQGTGADPKLWDQPSYADTRAV